MILDTPVTVQPPPFTRENGELRTFPTYTLNKLSLTIVDDIEARACYVRIAHFPFPLGLWRGDDYDSAGDYTQAQVEARVLELLGEDMKASLERLFVPPPRPQPPSPPPSPTPAE